MRETWEKDWVVFNPPPQKISTATNTDWWRGARYLFLSFIWALILSVGSRTGWAVFRITLLEFQQVAATAQYSLPLSAIAGALSAAVIWGIEGYIAYYGLYRPRAMGAGWWDRNVGTIAMVVAVLISATAGLDFVSAISDRLVLEYGTVIKAMLSLQLSVAITFVLYGVSEFAGRARWMHENMPALEDAEHQKLLQVWRSEMEKAWKRSAEYLSVMGEKERVAAEMAWDIKNAAHGRRELQRVRQQREIAGSGRIRPNSVEWDGPPKSDLVREFLRQYGEDNNTVPIPTIQEWIEERYGEGAVPAASVVSEVRTAYNNNGGRPA